MRRQRFSEMAVVRMRRLAMLTLPGLTMLLVGCARDAGSGSDAVPNAPLENTYWRVAEIRGRPAVVVDNQREAHLRFTTDSSGARVTGSTGCNRLTASFTRDGSTLRFGAAATTRMACVDSGLNEQERELLAVLQAATRHAIAGDTLTLSGDDGGAPLARLYATYMR